MLVVSQMAVKKQPQAHLTCWAKRWFGINITNSLLPAKAEILLIQNP